MLNHKGKIAHGTAIVSPVGALDRKIDDVDDMSVEYSIFKEI